MRKCFPILCVATILLSACMNKLPQRVMHPHYSFRNSNSQELISVERLDTTTVLSFKSFFRPHWWIRVVKGAYLTDGTNRYALIDTEGITPDEYLYMDDGGNAEYKLFFEPIPSRLREISYIENEEEANAFNFYHIDLSGKNRALLKTPSNLSVTLPQMELKSGESTLEVHLPCSLKGLPPVNVTLYVNDFFPPSQNQYSTVMDENGVASFTFEQHGPCRAFLVVGQAISFAYILIYPGETVTATVDASGRTLTAQRFKLDETLAPTAVYTGKYAALNNAGRIDLDYTFNVFNGQFASGAKTMSDYAAVVKDTYSEKIALLESNESIPPFQKEYLRSYIASQAITAISNAGYIRKVQYASAHDGDRTGYVNETFTPEDLSFLNGLDLNNPRMLLMGREGILSPILSATVFLDGEGLQSDYGNAYTIVQKVLKGHLPDDGDMAVLNALGTSFYKDCISSLVSANEKAKATVPDCVMEVPNVSSDKLLRAILERYRGKTVLVDFWATWCGPCRQAIKMMEPLKDNRFNEVSFVYVTSPTSPLPKWQEMIETIKGDHYYLTEEQFNAIYKQIGANAYPTYLIVDRDGKILKQCIGFKKEILDVLDNALK